MHCVIRNGQYIESEKLLFGDVVVPKRPHEKAEIINGNWALETTLSQEEYLELITKRQQWRTILNDVTI